MSDFVDVYNHSVKHLHLVEQSVEVLKSEITNAQQRIQQELGVEESFLLIHTANLMTRLIV